MSRHRGEWRGCGSLVLVRVLVVTWAPGGNLPPLVAAGSVLARRGHEVQFLASAETSELPKQLGFPVTRYRRSPNPETKVVFESQADVVMALMAGTEVALDARDVLVDLRPDLAIIDCMLPAAIAAARTTGTPTASLVHSSTAWRGRRCSGLEVAGRPIFTASAAPTERSGSLPRSTASRRGKRPRCCWSRLPAGLTSTPIHRATWSTQGHWTSKPATTPQAMQGVGGQRCC